MRINDLAQNYCLFKNISVGSFFKLVSLDENYCNHSSDTEKKHIDAIKSYINSYINSFFIKTEPVRAYNVESIRAYNIDNYENDYYNCVSLVDGMPIFLPVSSHCNIYYRKDIKLTFNSVNFIIKNPFMGKVSEGYLDNLKAVNFDSLKNGDLFIYYPSYDKPMDITSCDFYIKINEFNYKNSYARYVANSCLLNKNNVDSNLPISNFFKKFAYDSQVVNLSNMCTFDISSN